MGDYAAARRTGTFAPSLAGRLDVSARERVRTANLNFIRESGIRAVEANVVYAVATKA